MKTSGKNRNTMLIAGGAAALVIAAFLLVCVGLSTEKYDLPDGFVDKNAREDTSGLLIRNTIIRYAVKANITVFDISNRNLTVGVASQTDELNFGNLPQNITMRKFLNVDNNEQSPVKVCIIKRGDIADHMYVMQGNSMIIPGMNKGQIEVNYNATEIRNYAGEMDLVVRQPKYDILKYLTSFIGC